MHIADHEGERDVSIRSTHVGSLIGRRRWAFEAAIERGESYDEAAYARR